jgi:hypothetical protein
MMAILNRLSPFLPYGAFLIFLSLTVVPKENHVFP